MHKYTHEDVVKYGALNEVYNIIYARNFNRFDERGRQFRFWHIIIEDKYLGNNDLMVRRSHVEGVPVAGAKLEWMHDRKMMGNPVVYRVLRDEKNKVR